MSRAFIGLALAAAVMSASTVQASLIVEYGFTGGSYDPVVTGDTPAGFVATPLTYAQGVEWFFSTASGATGDALYLRDSDGIPRLEFTLTIPHGWVFVVESATMRAGCFLSDGLVVWTLAQGDVILTAAPNSTNNLGSAFDSEGLDHILAGGQDYIFSISRTSTAAASFYILDDIGIGGRFEAAPDMPEPAAAVLMMMGAGAVVSRRFRGCRGRWMGRRGG